MKRKTNGKAVPVPQESATLDNFFSAGDDGTKLDFGDVDWLACGRLVALLVGSGALVSFYISSADNTLCISVGAGERRKRYQTDTAEQFDQLVEGLIRRAGGPVLLKE